MGFVPAQIEDLTIDEARLECERILVDLGMPMVQVERLAEASALTPQEYRALRRLRSVEWCLVS